MRVFKHLTITDRIRIEKWLKDGLKVREISEKLRVDPSTVYRELKRGSYDRLNNVGTDPDIQPGHCRTAVSSTSAGERTKPENRQGP